MLFLPLINLVSHRARTRTVRIRILKAFSILVSPKSLKIYS
jgi:hypothetical protein